MLVLDSNASLGCRASSDSLLFQDYVGCVLFQSPQNTLLSLVIKSFARKELIKCGPLMHAVAAVSIPVRRLIHSFAIRVHAGPQTTFAPIHTR
jgi:hypothetical protein